jgi:hypothetical protein
MRLLLHSEAALVLLSLLTGLSRRLLDRGAAGYATLSCAAGREFDADSSVTALAPAAASVALPAVLQLLSGS